MKKKQFEIKVGDIFSFPIKNHPIFMVIGEGRSNLSKRQIEIQEEQGIDFTQYMIFPIAWIGKKPFFYGDYVTLSEDKIIGSKKLNV